jgi:uncharacterized protein YcfJ
VPEIRGAARSSVALAARLEREEPALHAAAFARPVPSALQVLEAIVRTTPARAACFAAAEPLHARPCASRAGGSKPAPRLGFSVQVRFSAPPLICAPRSRQGFAEQGDGVMGATGFATATVLGAIASVGAAAPALADHGHGNAYGHYSSTGYVYARVVDVDPMVRYVTVNRPHEECWTDYERQRVGSFGAAGQTAAGAVIGAAIGRQFGGGSGKDALTLLGAAAGGAIARERALRNGAGGYEAREVPVERCEVVNDRVTEERIDGYLVTYVYDGRTYEMQTHEHPGDRVRLAVDVRPVDHTSRYRGVRY